MEPISNGRTNTTGTRVAPTGIEHALRVLRRRWWVIAVCFLLTTVAAFALSKAQTKRYTATSSLLFSDSNVAAEASGVTPSAPSNAAGQFETNIALVLLGDAVPQRTAAKIGGGITAAQVKSAVTASPVAASGVVSVSATWTSPTIAARLANTYAQTFINQQLQSNQAQIQSAIDLVQGQYEALSRPERLTPQGQSLLDHLESLKILKTLQNGTSLAQAAAIPIAPSSPRVSLDVFLGAVFGLVLGLGLAFLLERFDRRLREASDVEETLGLPILGLIPQGAIPNLGKDLASRLEPFRILRTYLRYFNVDRELKLLLVTSSRPLEGKTTVASGIAVAAASMGTKTLLVDADLRKPTVAARFGLAPSEGLGGALVATGSLHDAVQCIDINGGANGADHSRPMDVLPAGPVPPNPAELLESHAMELLLEWAREHYELVIIDTAPLSVVADTIPLVKNADGVIIVSRLGTSTRDSAEHLRARLDSLGAPVLGVVVNDVRMRGDTYYGYGYAYKEKVEA